MPHRSPPKPPSQRQLRVGELIRHALSSIFIRNDIRDDALRGVVLSVSEVRVTPDLRHAIAFVMPLGGAGGGAEKVVAALARHARFLRGELAHSVELRHVPDLEFRVDTAFEEGSKVDRILASPEVRRDLGDVRKRGGSDGSA